MAQSVQTAKQENGSGEVVESGKSNLSAANKITKIVNDLFLPLLEHGQMKSFTSFEKVKVYDTSIVDFVAAQDPSLVASKDLFLTYLGERYDHWRRLVCPQEGEDAAAGGLASSS